MNKSKVFIFSCLSFIGGIFLRSFFNFDFFLVLYVLLVLALIILAVFYKEKKIKLLLVMLLFIFVGIWIADIKLKKIENISSKSEKFSGKVVILKEPETKEKYKRAKVKKSDGTKILLYANLYDDIEYGDELDLECDLKIPENFSEDFDYRMYLAKDEIFHICQNAIFRKTGNFKGKKIYAYILSTKNRLEKNINEVIPQPQAALANGLLFGGSDRLSERINDNFSKTGMTHIVAVSGYNVTIIAEYLILLGIFVGLWRSQSFWFALFGIFLFVAMIGFPSSAVRAGVMGGLLLWAMKNGRLANSTNAIFFAASIMLFINPLLLRWDIGFQLSFLATIGIVAFSPLWEKISFKKYDAVGMTEIIFLTLSAQVFVLPIIIFNFHTLSLVSIFANALILPIIPITMLFVFSTSIVGLFSQALSLPFAWISFLLLKYEVAVINILADIKWASIEIGSFHWAWLVVWYFVMTACVIFMKRKIKSIKNVE